ncbi:MAG: hypothetical protein JO235_04930 [Chroococcidiopsidaceae cyanobacterium CP_BM_RX_35]|nr:hypothetical protein [Chroococcidiopsidaceae cyanobacterium CP_BM_RX_35]
MNNRNRIYLFKSKPLTVCATPFLLLGLTLVVQNQALAAAQPVAPAANMPSTSLVLGLDRVFTYFFVMLGPIKLIAPFVQLTHNERR